MERVNEVSRKSRRLKGGKEVCLTFLSNGISKLWFYFHLKCSKINTLKKIVQILRRKVNKLFCYKATKHDLICQ